MFLPLDYFLMCLEDKLIKFANIFFGKFFNQVSACMIFLRSLLSIMSVCVCVCIRACVCTCVYAPKDIAN